MDDVLSWTSAHFKWWYPCCCGCYWGWRLVKKGCWYLCEEMVECCQSLFSTRGPRKLSKRPFPDQVFYLDPRPDWDTYAEQQYTNYYYKHYTDKAKAKLARARKDLWDEEEERAKILRVKEKDEFEIELTASEPLAGKKARLLQTLKAAGAGKGPKQPIIPLPQWKIPNPYNIQSASEASINPILSVDSFFSKPPQGPQKPITTQPTRLLVRDLPTKDKSIPIPLNNQMSNQNTSTPVRSFSIMSELKTPAKGRRNDDKSAKEQTLKKQSSTQKQVQQKQKDYKELKKLVKKFPNDKEKDEYDYDRDADVEDNED